MGHLIENSFNSVFCCSHFQDQFKKRIRTLETLLAEERAKSSSLQHSLEVNGSDVISSAMSDDAKLHMREKELLQSEVNLGKCLFNFSNIRKH